MGFEIKDTTNPKGDISIEITGLRPGEKLYEELLITDNEQKTLHPRIRTASELHMSWSEISDLLAQLKLACETHDQLRVREILLVSPTGFSPKDGICDLVWLENNISKLNS